MKKYSLELTGKLVDGTPVVVEADALSVEAPVFVIDEQGNKIPAPDGEHQLEGGPTIVTVAGKITEIKEEVEEVQEVVETKEEVKLEVDLEALVNQVSAIEASLSAAMIKIAELEKVKEEMSAEVEVKLSAILAPEVKSEPKKMTYRESILSKIG